MNFLVAGFTFSRLIRSNIIRQLLFLALKKGHQQKNLHFTMTFSLGAIIFQKKKNLFSEKKFFLSFRGLLRKTGNS